MILVGDSLGQVVLGYETTVRSRWTRCSTTPGPSSAARSARSSSATCRSCPTPRPTRRLENAGRFMQDGGAQAVKVEGGVRSARIVEALVKSGVPVMGHIGWTPQSQHGMGGKVKVQGKSRDAARAVLHDAVAIQEAGAFSIVLELVPEQLAAVITDAAAHPDDRDRRRPALQRPGPGDHRTCSGSATSSRSTPAPTRTSRARSRDATKRWMADVVAGTFPGPAESVRMDDDVLDEALGRHAEDRAAGAIAAA